MPQMNPMNWLLLLLFFNTILGLTGVKLHYLYKEVSLEQSEKSFDSTAQMMNLKI